MHKNLTGPSKICEVAALFNCRLKGIICTYNFNKFLIQIRLAYCAFLLIKEINSLLSSFVKD